MRTFNCRKPKSTRELQIIVLRVPLVNLVLTTLIIFTNCIPRESKPHDEEAHCSPSIGSPLYRDFSIVDMCLCTRGLSPEIERALFFSMHLGESPRGLFIRRRDQFATWTLIIVRGGNAVKNHSFACCSARRSFLYEKKGVRRFSIRYRFRCPGISS